MAARSMRLVGAHWAGWPSMIRRSLAPCSARVEGDCGLMRQWRRPVDSTERALDVSDEGREYG